MSGSLIKINQDIASSNPSTLTVTGITSDYNVYMVDVVNLVPNAAGRVEWRITKGGSIQTDSEYDNARKDMPTTSSFQVNENVNDDKVTNATVDNGGSFSAKFYLFNFANTGEYSCGTFETVSYVDTPQVFGGNGGFVHTVASASDGLSFHWGDSRTFSSGELHLYGLKK
tara:strand:+ start:473 stop:982 length:510 start_codon:yes stop_codon:yes gene_type:complete